jgi:hypothetical protein
MLRGKARHPEIEQSVAVLFKDDARRRAMNFGGPPLGKAEHD